MPTAYEYDMKKTILAGTVDTYERRAVNVFVTITYDTGRLSITGVVGPKSNGDAFGSCGQIADTLTDSTFRPAKNVDTVRLSDVWDRWHLNDMRAGCEHQRADGWDTRPIDPAKPLRSYGKHFPGQRQESWNMLTWVRADEHPDGLLSRPCPTCGYKYGTAWLREDVPSDVLTFLANLPDSPIPLPSAWT